MTNEQILDLINFISNKEQSGKTLKPEQFNVILPAACLEFFKTQRKEYERTQEVTNALKHLKISDYNLSVTVGTGIATGPTNYAYGGQLWYNDAVPRRRKIDIVTDSQFNLRQDSVLRQATTKKPIAKFVGTDLYFEPKTIGSNVKFSYIKKHTTPVLDYYIDTNDLAVYFSDPSDIANWSAGSYGSGVTVYKSSGDTYYFKSNTSTSEVPSLSATDWDIDEDYSHTLAGTEEGSAGQTATTTVNSLTIEMDWRDEDKLIIADIVLKKIGVNLKKPELVQYSELQKQERVIS
jgi:hypothetical protein